MYGLTTLEAVEVVMEDMCDMRSLAGVRVMVASTVGVLLLIVSINTLKAVDLG